MTEIKNIIKSILPTIPILAEIHSTNGQKQKWVLQIWVNVPLYNFLSYGEKYNQKGYSIQLI